MNAAGNDDASVNLWVENEDQSLRLPTGQAMLAMFEAIPTEELAALDADHEGVWSTAPTPIERRTAIEPAVLLTGLAKDHAVWQEAGAAFLSSSAAKFFDLKPAEDSRIAETALLRLSFSGSFVVDFTGFDGAGNMLFENVKSLRTQSAVKESTAETDRISPAEPKLKPVPIPTSTEKLIRLWSAYPTAEEERAWASDQDFMKRYFSPEQYDPVAETYGRALVEIARGRDRQLVAVETGQNAWALPETSTTRGKINLDPIETMLRNSKNGELENIQYTMDPIWITACPADLDEAASEEFSRTSLGTFMRAARDHGAISLMDVARYAADQPHYFGSRSTRALGCLEALLPGLSGANLMNAGEWPIKCFLGRLDAPQVSVAQQTTGLSLASCNAGQLEALSYAFRFTRFAARGRKDVWRSFPTDALPNGLPGDGVLHLATSTGQSVWARIRYPGGWVSSIYFAPEDFAKWLKNLAPRDGDQYELLGIRPAGRTTYSFRFDFPNEITTTETLDDDAPTGPEVKTVDDLPEPLRSQVKAAIQKAGSLSGLKLSARRSTLTGSTTKTF